MNASTNCVGGIIATPLDEVLFGFFSTLLAFCGNEADVRQPKQPAISIPSRSALDLQR